MQMLTRKEISKICHEKIKEEKQLRQPLKQMRQRRAILAFLTLVMMKQMAEFYSKSIALHK